MFVFLDYTTEVAKKHAAFVKVKKELHSCPGSKFGFLFPATLWIIRPDGQFHKLSDPVLAAEFVEKKIKI